MNPRLRIFKSLLLLFLFLAEFTNASSWRAVVSGGIGGAGIEKQTTVQGQERQIRRSESPGTVGLAIEKIISDKWIFSLDHNRGFRFGPFSTGVGFTGMSWRYFYRGTPPTIMHDQGFDFAFINSWSLFTGFSTGIAQGAIAREGDLVSSVSASGIYIGVKGGIDYQLSNEVILRPEINYSSTFVNSANVKSSLSHFSLSCGFIVAF